MDDATNPVGVEDTAVATLAEDTGVEGVTTDDQLYDDDGNAIAPAPEEEEVDLDDLKLKVPKDQAQKVKDAFLRQADYTRKTQEVAELRKAVEAERQSLHQASDAEIGALAQVTALDQQLAYYQRIDWDTWEQQDPFTASSEWRKFQQLQTTRQQAAGQFGQLKAQRETFQQQETAKLVEQARAELSSDPDIKWTPQKAAEMLSGAQSHYKLDAAEVDDGFKDARLVRILHDALQWRAHTAKDKQAQRHVAAQAVTPAAQVRPVTSPPPAGLDDRLSVDEWAKRRTAQVAKRGRR